MLRMRIVKFIISGGIGLSVNLLTYRFLVESLGVHYLAGSMLSLALSTVVGFLLQKFWTFEEHSRERAPKQFALYTLLAICDLGINTGVVFILTGKLGLYYLLSQAIGAGLVATINFCAYHFVIFRKESGGEAAL